MKNLFKFLFSKTQCQKSGICSTNPIINAINAAILNEIRQLAFYIVKLHEMNITNKELVYKTIEALSVNISDTDFSKSAVLAFYKNLRLMKENTKNFYTQKAQEMKFSYEFINPFFEEKIKDTTGLIKVGESIIREFYNTINEEKFRLIKLILLISKTASLKLVELQNYKEMDFKYCYEVLRLISLANHKTTREEKFKRRIKEFSEILYKIQKELDSALSEKFGTREGGDITTNIYEGKSILVFGSDLEELYKILEETKDKNINIYANPPLISAIFYPKFKDFPNFKGLYGIGEPELDFSEFKGAIYITKNSNQPLDNAFRGSIFTTKTIPYERAKSIDKNHLAPLIEEAERLEGFLSFKKGTEIKLEYNLENIKFFLEENRNNKILIYLGLVENSIKEIFKNYKIINLVYPYETEGLYYILENFDNSNIGVYFSECSKEVINTIISIINKDLSKIYIQNCASSQINPHIIASLNKDFNVSVI